MSVTSRKTLVFVCDDEPLDLSTIRRILEADGRFEVLTCSDYSGGVHLFDARGSEVEVALLDVALPGRNGVELARYLLARNPRVKVMFVSGHVGGSVLEHYGIHARDEHFLQKPFDSATLIRRVEQALATGRPLEFAQNAANASGSEE